MSCVGTLKINLSFFVICGKIRELFQKQYLKKKIFGREISLGEIGSKVPDMGFEINNWANV